MASKLVGSASAGFISSGKGICFSGAGLPAFFGAFREAGRGIVFGAGFFLANGRVAFRAIFLTGRETFFAARFIGLLTAFAFLADLEKRLESDFFKEAGAVFAVFLALLRLFLLDDFFFTFAIGDPLFLCDPNCNRKRMSRIVSGDLKNHSPKK